MNISLLQAGLKVNSGNAKLFNNVGHAIRFDDAGAVVVYPARNPASRMRRLDNMNALLHSKQKRQALISRANNVRLSVKAAIMRDVMNPQQADR